MDAPPSNREWDKVRLEGLLYHKGKVDDPRSFAQGIIRVLSTDIQNVDPERLAVHIYQRGLTSYNQFELLTSRILTKQQKSVELLKLLNQAATAFNPVKNINELYLALLDSCEEDVGLGGHHEIARSLRLQVLAALKINAPFHERDVKELSTVIARLKSWRIQERTGHLLRQNLGLGRASNLKQLEDVKEIVQEWYHSKFPTCTLADLVKGLMYTPSLGRLVSGLVPLCYSNTMIVRILIRNLRGYWKVFASYIGLSYEEIHSIEQSSYGTPGAQNAIFLRVWWMPDCGSSTQSILEKVQKLAKIPLWKPQSNVQDVQHGVSLTGQSQNVAVQVNNNYQVYYMIQPEKVEIDTPMRPQGSGSQPQTPMLHPRPPVGPPLNGEATPDSHNTWDEVVRYDLVRPLPKEPHHSHYKGGGVNKLKGQLSKESDPNNMEWHRASHTTLPKSMDQLTLSERKAVPKWHQAPNTAVPGNVNHALGYEKELTKCEQATVPKSVDNALGVGSELPKWHLALSTPAPKTVEGKGLLKACMEGDWEAASVFLESGSYVGERDEDGRNPLMHACKKKKADFVVKLLEGGADFADLDVNGHCCLHFPETLKNTELAQLLIGAYRGKRFSVDLAAVDNNHTPLMVACTIGDSVYPTAELLLKNGANPDGNANAHCRPLIEASARGYTRLVRLLLQYKANTDITDQSGSTALLQAINCHQVEIAFLLLDKGVNVNRQDHTETTPLFSAVTSNSYELVEKLIDKGVNIDASRFMSGPFSVGTMGDGTVEETPLAHACARGFLKIVELLIQKGADMNYLCSGTVPPLGFAIICKQMHVVSFLTRHSGLDRTIRGLSGPIIIAVKVENLRCAKMMLECLGGVSEALRAANMNQMYQLIEHIELYKAVVESVPDTSFEELQNDPDPIQARLQSAEHSKFEATIHRFCQICVAAVVNNPNTPQDGLISCAAAIAGSEVADFFSRCFKNTQRQNTLRQEFLSGNPSPSKFLIDNRMLTEMDFQTQALQFYPEGTESFYSDLVKAFQQLPGGHTLPNNVRAVLQRFFSGQFQVGCQIGLLGARGATYLPEIPCEVSSYGHSQWQQTTQVTAPIAVSSDSGSSNYTPMIDGVPIRRPKQLPSQGDTVLPPTSTHINAADADSNTSDVRAPSSTQMPEPHQVNGIDGITSAQDDGSGSEGTQPDSPLKLQHPERPHPVAVHEKKPESPPLTGTSYSTHEPEELEQQKKFAQIELFDNKSTQIVSVLQQLLSQTTADSTTLYSLYNIINASKRTEKEFLPQSFLEDKECQTQPEQREDKECQTQPEQREDKECQTQPEQREDKECQTQPEQREDKECQTQPITEHEQREYLAVAEQQKGFIRGYKILISLLFTLLLGMGFLLIFPPKMEQGNFKGTPYTGSTWSEGTEELTEVSIIRQYREVLEEVMSSIPNFIESTHKAFHAGLINESSFEDILSCNGVDCNTCHILLGAIEHQIYQQPSTFNHFLQLLRGTTVQPVEAVANELQWMYWQRIKKKLEAVSHIEPLLTNTVDWKGKQIYDWEDYGITLSIPEGAIPRNQTITLVVSYSTRTHDFLPDGYQLVSPMYTIAPSFNFLKSLMISIEHWAILENDWATSQLVFVHITAAGGTVIQSGRFQIGSSWGEMNTTSFSKFGIVERINGNVNLVSGIIIGSFFSILNTFRGSSFRNTNEQNIEQDSVNIYRVQLCTNRDNKAKSAKEWTSFICFKTEPQNELKMDICKWLKKEESWRSNPLIQVDEAFTFAQGCARLQLDEENAAAAAKEQGYTFRSTTENEVSQYTIRVSRFPVCIEMEVMSLKPRPTNLLNVPLVVKCCLIYDTQEECNFTIKNPSKLDTNTDLKTTSSQELEGKESICTSIPGIDTLIQALHCKRSEWQVMGETFGVEFSTMEVLRKNCGHDSEECYRRMLNTCLDRRKCNCWETVIDKLTQMDQNNLASIIHNCVFEQSKDIITDCVKRRCDN